VFRYLQFVFFPSCVRSRSHPVQNKTLAIITFYYCLVCSISYSVTSYTALLFSPSCFFLHLGSKCSSQLAVPRHRLSVFFPYGVRPSSRHLKYTGNKMDLFRRNTTVTYNHQHPSMATCFGLFQTIFRPILSSRRYSRCALYITGSHTVYRVCVKTIIKVF